MNERKKKKLKKLLKEYKEHLWDNINEEDNKFILSNRFIRYRRYG